MPNRFMARQGDVMVRQITRDADILGIRAQIDGKGLVEVPRDNDRVILAYGEVTGHAHAFHSPKVAMFRADGVVGGATYLEVAEDAALTHEEHDAITVPAGLYEVVRQREYDDSEEIARARYVAD